jgi:hypothetical protein
MNGGHCTHDRITRHPPDALAPWAEIVPDAPYPMTMREFRLPQR